jgi:nitric oxide reductase subunit C
MALTTKGAKGSFGGNAQFLVLFLLLTIDTHRQVKVLTVLKISPSRSFRKARLGKYNCNDCHTILGFGGYYAPDMTKVYTRIGKEGIRERVKKPEVVLASSWRKMPQQNVQDKEIENLLAFFKWVSEINTNDWPPQDSNKLPSSSIVGWWRVLDGREGPV